MNDNTSLNMGSSSLEARIVRYADLAPCKDAFIDTRSPGSDQKENFTIIGPGVAENPNQFVHISEPHGFNIGGARQPPRCMNSQHSHETAEVFYVHTGEWRFMTGENAKDGEVFIGPGDLITIPTRLFRGFENVGDSSGFLWAVLGGDDPGHVLWAPYVFDMAKKYGLVLLEDGTLIDSAKGERVPQGAKVMQVTTKDQVGSLQKVDSETLERSVVRSGDERPTGLFATIGGVFERVLVGAEPITWPHGFTVSEITLSSGAELPSHALNIPDVWFIQRGAVEVSMNGQVARCSDGDTITLPIGSARSLRNFGPDNAVVVQVRGGDALPQLARQ